MKSVYFVVAVCLFVAVQGLTEEQKERLKKHQGECLSESEVDIAAIQKLRMGDFKVDNQNLKKFALCMLIKSELMTKEGKFKKDVALSKIPVEADRAQAEKIIDLCLANKGNTPEQSAWNYVRCYHEKNPKHPLL